MKEIEVNNGRKIVIDASENKFEIIAIDSNGSIEYSYNIPDGEIVMLLNYYRACKDGNIKSDFISEGKIINTNIQ